MKEIFSNFATAVERIGLCFNEGKTNYTATVYTAPKCLPEPNGRFMELWGRQKLQIPLIQGEL